MRALTVRAWRLFLLVAVAATIIVVVAFHGPIAQDPRYHDFADRRTLFGVPNFWNVASNLPFLFVGIAGLVALHRRSRLEPAYTAFFLGAILISIGSAWYHLQPNDATLTWDRLPMTISFMAFGAIVIGEHLNAEAGRRSLAPLLLLGAASVVYWWIAGDLRPYLVIQFLPMALVPMIMLLFPSQLAKDRWFWAVVIVYGAAKVFEMLDHTIYNALGISGHTLKHLTAACAMSFMVSAVRRQSGNALPQSPSVE